ncbi:unnamed protein product, partial [Rotaria sordida]
ASETSERWANISAHIDEQIMDLSRDVDRLTTIDEQFVYIYVNIDGNRQLYFEIKRLHDRLDDYHRTENLMHAKIDEQDINLNQLRKELNSEIQAHSEAELTIEKLKHTFDETTFKYDKC